MIKGILFAILFLWPAVQVFAHGDLSMRIAEKTIEISEDSSNFELYYERGLLYQQHMEYSNALEDFLTSKSLGNSGKSLYYAFAEVYYLIEDYNKALKSIVSYLELDSINVKAIKLEAQILFHLKLYKKSLEAYRYVIHNMIDIRPEDILEYSNFILAENNKNYSGALKAIQYGLDQLGPHTISLQLKKLDYLIASDQIDEALEQFNYFILQYDRNEFWYFKKAKYLAEINRPREAFISLKLASVAIGQLDEKFKNMDSVIILKEQIKSLENSIKNLNHD